LMGMPVQWKPWGKSTRLPVSRWYAHANSSCDSTGRAVSVAPVAANDRSAAWASRCITTEHADAGADTS